MKFDERECPNCKQIARADFVDNGVGMQQCGPFGCEACGWVQTVDPIEDYDDEITDEQYAAIREAVGPIDWDQMETVSGPGWPDLPKE